MKFFLLLKEDIKTRVAYWVFIVTMCILVALSGCKSLEKSQNRVINSGTLPDLCAKFYPATVIKGDTLYSTDTAWIYSPPDLSRDSFHVLYGDTVFLTSTAKIQRITITKIVHDTIIDEAKLAVCQREWTHVMNKNSEMSQEILKITEDKNKAFKDRNWAIGILASVILGFAIFTFIRGKLPL